MGGSLGFVSKFGTGSTFFFDLKLQMEREKQNENGSVFRESLVPFSPHFQKPVILLDDRRVRALVLSQQLLHLGVRSTHCTSLQSTLYCLRSLKSSSNLPQDHEVEGWMSPSSSFPNNTEPLTAGNVLESGRKVTLERNSWGAAVDFEFDLDSELHPQREERYSEEGFRCYSAIVVDGDSSLWKNGGLEAYQAFRQANVDLPVILAMISSSLDLERMACRQDSKLRLLYKPIRSVQLAEALMEGSELPPTAEGKESRVEKKSKSSAKKGLASSISPSVAASLLQGFHFLVVDDNLGKLHF